MTTPLTRVLPTPEVELVDINELNVDPQVQRRLITTRVSSLIKAFDPSALGIVTLSRRGEGAGPDAAYVRYVVDGQHRIEAARAKSYAEKIVANTYTGLSLAEEAYLFATLNNTKAPNSFDLYRIRLLAGERVAKRLDEILTSYDWTAGTTANPSGGASTGHFAALHTLERLFRLSEEREQDPNAADLTVGVLTATWGHQRVAVNQSIVLGVGKLFLRYGPNVVDAAALAVKLGAETPQTLLAKARGLTGVTNSAISEGVADMAVRLYNKNLKASALPAWTVSR